MIRRPTPRKPASGNFLFACILGALCWAEPAAADGECRLNGASYPQSVTVCSNGLALTCSNGTWQDNNGQRCDQPTGTFLGPRRPFREKNTESIPEEYRNQLRSAGSD